MCLPILIGGLFAGGSLLGGAGIGASLLTGAMGAMTAYSGIESANAGLEAAYAQGEANFIQSEEMMKKIEIIEAQALQEEVMRRDQFDYFTSKNLASAAATGATSTSESFEAMRKRNERTFNIDENVAEFNETNAKGQTASQAQQFSRAGFAAISGGQSQYKQNLLQTGVNLLTNAPMMDFSNIGVVRSTNNVNGGPMSSSPRPQMRPY